MNVAIVTVSDRASNGDYDDATGPALQRRLTDAGIPNSTVDVVPDERALLTKRLTSLCDAGHDVVLTAGGTGLSPRDVTPEATLEVIERMIPGIPEAMRAAGRTHTPLADLSRGVAGQRGTTLIVNLPGSPKGAVESLDAILPLLSHAVDVMTRPS